MAVPRTTALTRRRTPIGNRAPTRRGATPRPQRRRDATFDAPPCVEATCGFLTNSSPLAPRVSFVTVPSERLARDYGFRAGRSTYWRRPASRSPLSLVIAIALHSAGTSETRASSGVFAVAFRLDHGSTPTARLTSAEPLGLRNAWRRFLIGATWLHRRTASATTRARPEACWPHV